MNNRIFFRACSFLLLSTVFMTCDWYEEDEPSNSPESLPAKTTSGKNTFGCLINGEPFITCCPDFFDCDPFFGSGSPSHLEVSESPSIPNKYSVYSRNDDRCHSDTARNPLTVDLSFQFDKITKKILSYHILHANYNSDERLCKNINGDLDHTDTLNPRNFVRITKFDESARIISGEFEFDIFKPTCTDTVKVRSGRFDFKF